MFAAHARRALAAPSLTSAVRTAPSAFPHVFLSSSPQPRAASTLAVVTQLSTRTSTAKADWADISAPYVTARSFGDLATASIETEELKPVYTTVHHPVQVDTNEEQVTNKFAVVALAGSQYKVTEGDVLIVNQLKDAEVGQTYTIDQVLLTGSKQETSVGRPLVAGAQVIAQVEQHTLDKKILVFKRKRRKHHKKMNGARRHMTVLRIEEIKLP